MSLLLNTSIPASFPVPGGYSFGTAEAAVKYPGRLDLGMIVSHLPATCAGVFTQNRFAAAPVQVCVETLNQSPLVQGVVVNAGCANAATGEDGMAHAREMADMARAAIPQAKAPFMVSSTGTIGVKLPMDRIQHGIERASVSLKDSPAAYADFSRSIMTTDTVPKVAAAVISTPEGEITITGCAKGSGMIHPRMATMLSYLATDAKVSAPVLDKLFRNAIERTLNCVTVDGDTSTNDTALLFANGASGVDISESTDLQDAFSEALMEVLTRLARLLARDGEGATHLIEVQVSGTQDFTAARTAALAVANSPLVKTAIYGRDANWGRIACALGNSGVSFQESDVTITMGDLKLLENGTPLPFSEERALEILAEEIVQITAIIGTGPGSATAYTCDLTEKYIEINGSYRT